MTSRRWAIGFVCSAVAALAAGPVRAQTDSTYTRIALSFVRHMEAGAFDTAAAMISRAVPAGTLDEPRLRQVWAQLGTAAGTLRSLAPLRTVPQDTLQIVELSARFERQSFTIRVVLMPDRTVGGLWFLPAAAPAPPPYADTTAFLEVDVTVGAEPWPLAGTLSLPKVDSAPLPAVVLVHGSGPHDRDESIGPNKPFRDIAWGLASRGIAVLRYDKRTWAHAGRMPRTLSVQDEVQDDAIAAAQLLRAHPRIDSTRVFVAGHSLGGMMAPRVAASSSAVAGIILLAAPARPLQQVVRDQVRYLESLTETDAQTRSILRAVLDSLDLLQGRKLAPESLVMGAPASYYYDLDDYEPVRTARRLERPILVLHAMRDYQVTESDLNAWISGLQGRDNATVLEYGALNHLFMEGRGRAVPSEYAIAGHVADTVIRDIADWVLQRRSR